MSSTISPSGAAAPLHEFQRLPTSGVRAVAQAVIEGRYLLAIPQLAEDIPGAAADMNGGDSDTDLLLYEWRDGAGFGEVQRLAIHGGEDAEFFTIDGAAYLAVACIRSGHGPYDLHTNSVVFRWRDGGFAPFQEIPTFAAKFWRYFGFDGRHFLVVAAGVAPEVAAGDSRSTIYEWSGDGFEPFQTLPSVWAYGWEYFELAGGRFLGLSDHIAGMHLYRWEDGRFAPFQDLGGSGTDYRDGPAGPDGARDMAFRYIDGQAYLACANLLGSSRIYRWDGARFEPFQTFRGTGGRRFRFFEADSGLHLIRINFIRGQKDRPDTQLESQIYTWSGEGFAPAASFVTDGGTDALHFRQGGQDFIAVSNSLSKEIRFRTDSIVYRWGE
jgi:hypothetical protein